MSIINDALKKLQNDISSTTAKPAADQNAASQTHLTPAQQAGFQPIPSPGELQTVPSQTTEQQPPAPTAAKSKESRIVYILGILCLMIGLFAPIVNKQSVIGMLIERWPKQTKSKVARPVARPAVVRAPGAPSQQETPRSLIDNIKAMASPAPTPTASSKGRITVNGIMARGKQNLALIDGQVYEEGEEIDGVKLIKITPNSIVVLENGAERTIKVAGGR